MDRFSDDRGALDFIASRIADEAQREGVSFSEIERKMLYFSETAWTLPEIWDVSDEFDEKYDREAYEKKVSQLIKKSADRGRKRLPEEYEAWTEAIRHLSKDDRYLLVMVRQAGLRAVSRTHRGHGKMWRVWVTCGTVIVLFGGLVWCLEQLFPPRSSIGRSGVPITDYSFAFWTAIVCVVCIYSLIRFLVGSRKWDGLMARAVEWIFGKEKRAK
jgi:hypothetical protein